MTEISAMRERLQLLGTPFKAGDNIASVIKPSELDLIEAEVAYHLDEILFALLIDRDHNTHDTPKRVAKMLVREAFAGRYTPRPTMTDFPNARQLDEIYTVGPITVRSTCAHHLLPIIGQCWVGVKPGERVIGLSKFTRLARWVMARPHIQEEAVVLLADEIETAIKPEGLAVVIRASHQCVSCRGVVDDGQSMVTSVMRGFFLNNHPGRDELMTILQGQGF